jgi:hypothetical protein
LKSQHDTDDDAIQHHAHVKGSLILYAFHLICCYFFYLCYLRMFHMYTTTAAMHSA